MHYTKSLQVATPRLAKKASPGWVRMVPYWLFLFSFAFDFKGGFNRSGSIDQVISAFAFMGSTLWILLRKRTDPVPVQLTKASIAWWSIILIGAFATTVTVFPPPYADQPVMDSVIVSLPLVIVGCVLLVSQTLLGTGLSWLDLRKAVLLAALCNALSQAAYGVFGSGASVDNFRNEATSTSNLFLFAIGFMEVVVPGIALDSLSFISLFVSVFLIGMSIERSYLITMSIVILVVFVMAFRIRKSRQIKGFWRQFFVRSIVISILLVVSFSVLVAIRPNVLVSWQKRIERMLDPNVQNSENTPAMRLAQYEYSARVITQDPLKFVTGVGFWRTYPIIGSRNRFILTSGQTFDYYATADSIWYFPFLISGVLGGFTFLGLYAILIYKAGSRIRHLDEVPPSMRWQTCAGIVLLVVTLASSLGNNGLYFRYYSLMLGLSIVLVLSPIKESKSSARKMAELTS